MQDERFTETKPYSIKKVSHILLIVMLMVILFDSSGILSWANRMKIGATRDFFISIFQPIDSLAHRMYFDRPKKMMREAFRNFACFEQEMGFISEEAPFGKLKEETQREQRATATDRKNPVAHGKQVSIVNDKSSGESKNDLNENKIIYSFPEPLQVLIIGDSMMGQGLGSILQRKLEMDSMFVAYRHYKDSSGLTRVDYYNWYSQINQLFDENPIDVVIIMFGTNDAQDVKYHGYIYKFGSKEWSELYHSRVASFIYSLTRKTQGIFWLGMPPMRQSNFDKNMRLINNIFQEEVNKAESAYFISTEPSLGDSSGNFTTYLTTVNKTVRIRQEDGIHLSIRGGIIVSNLVIDSIKSRVVYEKAF